MSKKPLINGTPGNFGNYGGANVKKKVYSSRGYYQILCCIVVEGKACNGKALYHCGGDGYCKVHRYIAVDRLTKRGTYLDLKDASFNEDIQSFDEQDLKLLKAKRYPTAGLRMAKTRSTLKRDLQRKLKARKG